MAETILEEVTEEDTAEEGMAVAVMEGALIMGAMEDMAAAMADMVAWEAEDTEVCGNGVSFLPHGRFYVLSVSFTPLISTSFRKRLWRRRLRRRWIRKWWRNDGRIWRNGR